MIPILLQANQFLTRRRQSASGIGQAGKIHGHVSSVFPAPDWPKRPHSGLVVEIGRSGLRHPRLDMKDNRHLSVCHPCRTSLTEWAITISPSDRLFIERAMSIILRVNGSACARDTG